jgi:hypothetical protein
MMKGGDRARSPPSSFPACAAVILLPFPSFLERRSGPDPLAYMQPMKPLARPPLVAGARRVERVPG